MRRRRFATNKSKSVGGQSGEEENCGIALTGNLSMLLKKQTFFV
jgi:hypothetical protein